MTNSHEITLETYKELSQQEFLKWDNLFDSFIISYDDELHYTPDTQPEIPELVQHFNKKKKTWH